MGASEDTLRSALNIVKRLTQTPELKRKIEEIVHSRKTAFLGARLTAEEYAMIELIASKLGTTKSEAVRYLIRLGYGLLSGAPEIQAGKIVIQNPIVNMNISKAEARPQVNVNVDLSGVVDELKRLRRIIASQPRPAPKQLEILDSVIGKLEKEMKN
jgi:hypothetical protein